MTAASQENARMLASIMGVDEEQAAVRLDRQVLLTSSQDDRSRAWTAEIRSLLERTVKVTDTVDGNESVELVVGSVQPRSAAFPLFADIESSLAFVDVAPVAARTSLPHPLFATIAACSVAAAVLNKAIDAAELPQIRLPATIRFSELGLSAESLAVPIELSGPVLVGAGAVAHAFIRALRHLDVRGSLPIVDPKKVGAGNSNRCLYLSDGDVGKDKAVALAMYEQADLPRLTLRPFVEEFSAYSRRVGVQDTVIVTVDSRRARRAIQSELPRRVIDASTTDIRAVVVHSHRQPTENACLSCIYRHVPNEHAREKAIADGLGIGIDMVKEGLISSQAAALIARVNTGVQASEVEGKAFDSLYKALCAEQALRTPEGRQVLAPFAFVSALAGALLVVELLRSETGIAKTNYWQVTPWGSPVGRIRSVRPRAPDCEFCSKPHILAAANEVWNAAPAELG